MSGRYERLPHVVIIPEGLRVSVRGVSLKFFLNELRSTAAREERRTELSPTEIFPLFVCLFVFMLQVPVNNFSIISGRFPVRIKCIAKGRNIVPLTSLELVTSRSQVEHPTTEPLRSYRNNLSTDMRFQQCGTMYMRPARAQTSLRMHAV